MKVNNFKMRKYSVYLGIWSLIFLFASCNIGRISDMNSVWKKKTKTKNHVFGTTDSKPRKTVKNLLNREKSFNIGRDQNPSQFKQVKQPVFYYNKSDESKNKGINKNKSNIDNEECSLRKLGKYNIDKIDEVFSNGDVVIMRDQNGVYSHASIYYEDDDKDYDHNDVGALLSGIKRKSMLGHLRHFKYDAIVYRYNPRDRDQKTTDTVRNSIGDQAKYWHEKISEALPECSYNFEDLYLYMLYKHGSKVSDKNNNYFDDYDSISENLRQIRSSCIENEYLNILLFIMYGLRKNVTPSLYNGFTCLQFVIVCIGSTLLQDLLKQYCINKDKYASEEERMPWPLLEDPYSSSCDHENEKICQIKKIADVVVNTLQKQQKSEDKSKDFIYQRALQSAVKILTVFKYPNALKLLYKPTSLEQKHGIYTSQRNAINSKSLKILMSTFEEEFRSYINMDEGNLAKVKSWGETIKKGLDKKNECIDINMSIVRKMSIPDYFQNIDPNLNLNDIVNGACNLLGEFRNINIKWSSLKDFRTYLDRGPWSKKIIKIKKDEDMEFFIVKEIGN